MMNNPMQNQFDEMHRKNLMREADNARLAHEAQPENGKLPVYGPALAWLGSAMMNVGNGLQERYGRFDERPAKAERNYYQADLA